MEKVNTQEGGMVTVETVAAELGTTKLNILMHLKKGLLTGEERDGEWLVSFDSVEAYKDSQGEQAESLCTSGCAKAASCGGGCS